ncbi:MAG: tRNA (N(6)-L-threonylcarbamoyladenosine(37)-C(2))-methylthiotransferase MtaB [Lentisphaeria bacterium]|nr:tRNA (N(6)-L-threonylcarbamoyladenosine(37)-C(2))-methylthiotransferase MtaB [Lentisphaeria bacterium]
MKKFAEIHTLGCRLNIADSALLTARLERAGYEVCRPGEGASPDLIVVNSCAVTAEASAKSRRLIRRLRREHPGAQIVVTGCAAQLAPDSFLAAGADLALPNAGKTSIPDGIYAPGDVPETQGVFSEGALSEFPFRSRAFIKIQEGCNNFCSYCIVPYVRGRERSRALEEVLADCRKAAAAGFPEIVLTGVNTCAYRDGGTDLAGLIRLLCDIPGSFRLRLSSTEPRMDNFAMIDAMAGGGEKVCRFLHLSLQYGCDRILERMNRRYTCAEYRDFVLEARKKLPGVHVGTDIIVGFPGETDEDFAQCMAFVREMAFANIHIFSYSPRPGTPAAEMPGRPDPALVKERFKALEALGAESAESFARSQLGKEVRVIFERSEKGLLRGWSDNYLGFAVPDRMFPTGKIVSFTAKEEFLEKESCAE